MDYGCERFGKPRKKRREKLEELERENRARNCLNQICISLNESKCTRGFHYIVTNKEPNFHTIRKTVITHIFDTCEQKQYN